MIYFDNSATTKPFDDVLQSYVTVSQNFYGNPSSLHQFGGKAERLISQARKQIAQLLQVNEQEIIFTSGGTEANNLAIKGIAYQYANRGKHIITSQVEHPSVYETMEQLKKDGFSITYLPVNHDGIISIHDLQQAITKETILVSVMHVNNEVGAVQPIQEIGKLLKQHSKIFFHVDNVQGFGKLPLSLYNSDIDLVSASGHKFHGVKGSGFLFKKKTIKLTPMLTGGNQESKWRSGTENTGAIVSMAKALRLTEENRKTQLKNIHAISTYLHKELKQLSYIYVHTNASVASPFILSFSIEKLRGEIVVHALEEKGFIVSTTSACSSKQRTVSRTLSSMNVDEKLAEGTIRVSLSYENNLEEAEMFIQAIKEIHNNLLGVKREKNEI